VSAQQLGGDNAGAVEADAEKTQTPECPNSALSSNRELDQAGPRPLRLELQGVVAGCRRKIEEQPVALATPHAIAEPTGWRA